MDRDLRAQWMSRLPKEAMEVTTLSSIAREYTLVDIAIMTRAAPAKLLGLKDRGHLGAGARRRYRRLHAGQRQSHDVPRGRAGVQERGAGRARWRRASCPVWADASCGPDCESAIELRMRDYYDERYGLSPDFMTVPDAAIGRPEPFEIVPCNT